jgi:hypothetical protein
VKVLSNCAKTLSASEINSELVEVPELVASLVEQGVFCPNRNRSAERGNEIVLDEARTPKTPSRAK